MARALVRLARQLSNVRVTAMRLDVGADLLEAAKADGAKAIEIAEVPGTILRIAIARSAIQLLRMIARSALTEIGLMRHQEGDEPDPEDRADDHVDTPNFSFVARACVQDLSGPLNAQTRNRMRAIAVRRSRESTPGIGRNL